MTIQLVLSVKDDYFLSIQLLVRKNFLHFHHSSFYFSKGSHSRRNICRRNVCRRSVVDEMSVEELSYTLTLRLPILFTYLYTTPLALKTNQRRRNSVSQGRGVP